MKPPRRIFAAALVLACLPAPWAQVAALTPAADSPAAPAVIPFSQLGAEADKQGAQAASSITPSATGAHLRALMQDLEAEAAPDGLWLTSTADEDAGKPHRLRVRAVGLGRAAAPSAAVVFGIGGPGSPAAISAATALGAPGALPLHALPASGPVRAGKDAAVWVRPGLVEEYRVSTDGVRQDFIVMQRPAGAGEELAVDLEVTGARAETAAYGVKLTVSATGRELAYSRLKVTDAAGKELTARLDVVDAGRLRVIVRDAGAAYPLRIDPTFSDADWVALNPSISGANSTVLAFAVDGGGNLYAGGEFTAIGTVAASRIAKWDGSAWSALGTGMNSDVSALAVSGGDLYAGGAFTTAGGTSANRIAKWDGSAWSALGTGMDNSVRALAVSGGELYAGGNFTAAGGTTVNRIAKWNGSAWSALGSGMNSTVRALAADASGHLFVGGSFLTAGTTFTPYIAQANISGLTPIESWRQVHFGTTDNTGNAADLFDHDLDGLVNLLEYAFGLNPTLITPTLPGLTREGGYLTMTITKQPGVTYEVQTAGDLATGQPDSFSAASTTVLINDATTLKVRDNILISSTARRFLQVLVTAAP
ncbi:MAG TPA: hypothetical protein PK490_04570 [Prosthecobacter sp.]|nr:hypothetical protein [Prosthecobacter sp.]